MKEKKNFKESHAETKRLQQITEAAEQIQCRSDGDERKTKYRKAINTEAPVFTTDPQDHITYLTCEFHNFMAHWPCIAAYSAVQFVTFSHNNTKRTRIAKLTTPVTLDPEEQD